MAVSDARSVSHQLVDLGASLFARGFSVGSAGNISVRVDGGFVMTPTNAALGRLSVAGLSRLDEGFRHIGGDPPSKEVVLHRAVYLARPEAQAVVHLHSPYATALSCLADFPAGGMTVLTPYHVMRLGSRVPLVRYAHPGSDELTDEVVAAMRSGPAALLANHGTLVAGSSLADAVNAAEELEASAQLAHLVRGQEVRGLTEDQIAELERMRIA